MIKAAVGNGLDTQEQQVMEATPATKMLEDKVDETNRLLGELLKEISALREQLVPDQRKTANELLDADFRE